MTQGLKVDGKGEGHIDKDPNALLDYTWDWSDWLDGDQISTVDFPSPVAVTIDSYVIEDKGSLPNQQVKVWILGGTVGEPAQATCRIETIGGRIDDRTIIFKIRER